jgi:signal peptidase
MKKAFGWVATVLLLLIIAGLAFVYFSPDYNIYLVRSESMAPTINMGDMVVVGPLDNPLGKGVEAGSVVTYERGGELITHRVLSVDGQALLTKGDAVEDPDPWTVTMSDVRGVYLFRIPYAGYLSNFVRTRAGWLLAIVIPAAIVVGLIFREIHKELKKSKEARRRVSEM